MDTKKRIADSMFNLLKSNSFDKITVQTILDDCKVSRSTFYRYFDDKYELMNWCYQSYVDTLLSMDGRKRLHLIYQFLDDNHKYFERATKVHGKNSFLDFLYNYTYNLYKGIYLKNTNSSELSDEARVILEYACAGAVHILDNWLNNGRKESVSEMAEWTFNLIPEIYRQYL
ncbi:MAG TPA: TetR family transcriptional regulator [Clostridiales bacterium]|nr:TetR family transcriptional regulator [Clostridiales bacterium]